MKDLLLWLIGLSVLSALFAWSIAGLLEGGKTTASSLVMSGTLVCDARMSLCFPVDKLNLIRGEIRPEGNICVFKTESIQVEVSGTCKDVILNLRGGR